MICDNSTVGWAKYQKRDKQIGFVLSLSIHVILLFIGGSIFFKTPKFSIESVSETTEVSLVDAVEPIEESRTKIEPLVTEVSPAKTVENFKSALKKPEKIVKFPKTINQAVKVIANPNYFQNSPPEYPELAKQMRQEGLVILAVVVNREGIPIKVEVVQSSHYRMLDQAALKAVSNWKFQPGRIGDFPIESKVTVPIRFQLQTK